MQTEFAHTFMLWLVVSGTCGYVIRNTIQFQTHYEGTLSHLEGACMISVVIGTCVRLNSALPYLVLATVFEATAIILSSMSVAKFFIMLTPT